MAPQIARRDDRRHADETRPGLVADASGAVLSGLVTARFTHDLAGPMSAITNGVDLLSELGDQATPDDLALVTSSAARSAALMKGLRLAFGDAAPDGTPRARRDVLATLQPIIAGRRIHLACLGEDGPALSQPAARLAALMVFAGKLTLGLEGALELVLSQATDLPIRVIARGPRATLKPEAAAWLRGSLSPAPRSGEVEFAMLAPAATLAGCQVEVKQDDGAVSFVAAARGG
ncbi:MAG: histidine phosphotransferase family protein [Pseudomonadota bacterium]